MTSGAPGPAATGDAGASSPSPRGSPWRTALEMLGFGPPPPGGHRFHALISYSHAGDVPIATALQTGLQRFARPWYRTRALHVFRDNASLSANPHLWASVQAALDDSQHFILLASREAAASAWVGRECAYWRETKSCERLLIVLTDGEIAWDEAAGDFDGRRTTALPAVLRGAFEGEPRWIDLRWARGEGDLTLRNARMREAVVELAAPLHGVPRDELESTEVRERRRAVRLARGATAALALLTTAAVIAAVLAVQARDQADREAALAQSRALAVQARDEFATQSPLVNPRPDLGVLLALEAYRSAPTVEARAAVLSALGETNQVVGYLRSAGGPIDGIAYSPDGRTIAMLLGDGGVELWSAATRTPLGSPLALPPGTFSYVKGTSVLAFSPDGRYLALASVGRTGLANDVVAWNLRTHRLLGPPLKVKAFSATAVAFAPSGNLVVGLDDGTVETWNLPARRRLDTLPVGCPQRSSGTVNGVSSLAVSRGATVIVGCEDGRAWVWAPGRGSATPSELAPPPGALHADVAIRDDGGAVAVGYSTGQLGVWTLAAGRPEPSGPVRTDGDGNLEGVQFSPDGQLLAAIYSDGQARVWGMAGAQPVWSFEGTAATQYGVAWSANGRVLATAGTDGLAVLWEAPSGPLGTPSSDLAVVLGQGAQSGGPVEFSPDGGFLASVEPGGVQLWTAATGRPLGGPIAGTAGAALSDRIALGPGLLLDALPSASGFVVRGWNLADPRSPRPTGIRLRTGATGIAAMALDRDGGVLALAVTLANTATGVEIWHVQSGSTVFVPVALGVHSLSFSPTAPVLALGVGHGAVQTIDYARRAPRPYTLVAPTPTSAAVVGLAYSPDGAMLAATDGADVTLRRSLGAQQIGTVAQGGADLDALAFSPDGEILAMADSRGYVQLIDVASEGALGGPLTVYGSRAALANAFGVVIDSVAFSADGALLAASGSGPVTLWNHLLWTGAAFAQRRARLCSVVGRNLTPAEWASYLPGEPYRRTCPQWP